MSYITWEYYNSFYTEVPKEEFDRFNNKATVKLDVYTHMRARNFVAGYDVATATEFQKQVYGQIQNTVGELMNAMYVQEVSGMGSGIASVSNDGYSESYKITTAADKEAQLLTIARSGLSGTGLVGAL